MHRRIAGNVAGWLPGSVDSLGIVGLVVNVSRDMHRGQNPSFEVFDVLQGWGMHHLPAGALPATGVPVHIEPLPVNIYIRANINLKIPACRV